MIIPPDPEKDPNIFSASSSTPSLALPSEFDDTTSRWDGEGESLPPYEGRRRSRVSVLTVDSERERGREIDREDVFGDRHAAPMSYAATESQAQARLPGIIIPTQPQRIHSSPLASSAGSLTPTASGPSVSLPRFHSPTNTLHQTNEASTSKLWEGTPLNKEGSKGKGKRVCGVPPPPEGFRRWWKRWRRWVQAVIVLVLIGIGLVAGLLVGMRQNRDASSEKYDKRPPWMDQDTDGKRVATWAGNGSFNLTYSDTRDGPPSWEGNFTDCNPFSPFNFSASPFESLFTPFPYSTLSLASFSFPLSSSGLPPSELFISAFGLGSSGTTTVVGLDSTEQLITSGVEGKISIDVVVRYSGAQQLGDMMRVCKMTKGDSAVGVGIYSPKETDGKMGNPYKLNPALVPTSQVIIRLPPSLYSQDTPAMYVPSLSVNADRMIVNLGNLENVVAFGDLDINLCHGGVRVNYVEAGRTSVVSMAGDVAGKWNVSESLVVNVTSGSVKSDIILYDPANFDNSSALPPITDYTVVPRSASPSDESEEPDQSEEVVDEADQSFEDEIDSLFNATIPNNVTSPPARVITTNLFTEEGSVDVKYLHHPPTIQLSAIIATQEGNLNAHFHPTYVGPFVAKTIWGQVNVVQPRAIKEFDPFSRSRERRLLLGAIEVGEGSPFSTVGYNTTILQESTDTVSGVVYWAERNLNRTLVLKDIEQVQESDEAEGNSIVVLGGWGNVDVSFDRA